ncbi:cellulose biosynthesis protein BcsN [Rhizobium sp. TRM95111]|uniref:cellulose biosynthesis protein BcsN n=1 Tax=Rhizobium alarense TaxID=2846851 RepID=UPI001F48D115|nr:cellulose biosynthesis protein BcsN [Rhizobium alarense]MCF3640810.1 cellulose biosynthesis protein BcsN [Rhizobium alarense]
MKRLFFLVLALAHAGCTSVSDPFLETGSIGPDAPPIATEVSPEFAAAYLPSISGSIASVRQTVQGRSLEQSIVYPNATALAGENVLMIKVAEPSGRVALLHSPTRDAVLAEMRSALPGVAMRIEPAPGENLHGAFGYATGELAGGGSCLYAWQLSKRVSPAHETLEGRMSTSRYAAQVRLRYCHPSMPRDRIPAIMAAMRLKPVTDQTFDLLRYASGSGSAIPFTAEPVEQRVVRREPAEVAAIDETPTGRRRPAAREETAEAVQPSNAVKVPMPGDTETGAAVAAEATDVRTAVASVEEAGSGKAIVPMPDEASGAMAD